MRLIDLAPRWLTPNVFAFRCPACKHGLLSVKNVPMAIDDQFAIFEVMLGNDAHYTHPCKAPMAWTFSGTDFASLTVSPSLNVEGHWHHTITNGEIH